MTHVPFRIFISYRHEDVPGHVGWFCECLSQEPFGRHIFWDVATIGPGAAWRKVINEAVRASDAFICIFGPHWLRLLRERVESGKDEIVTAEIESALKSELEGRREVIPVAVSGAELPSAQDLPIELADLWEQNIVHLRDEQWHEDLRPLLGALSDLWERKKRLWPASTSKLSGAEIAERSWSLLNPPLMMGRNGGLSGKLMTADFESGAWRNQKYEVRYEESEIVPNWFPVKGFLDELERRGEWPPS